MLKEYSYINQFFKLQKKYFQFVKTRLYSYESSSNRGNYIGVNRADDDKEYIGTCSRILKEPANLQKKSKD